MKSIDKNLFYTKAIENKQTEKNKKFWRKNKVSRKSYFFDGRKNKISHNYFKLQQIPGTNHFFLFAIIFKKNKLTMEKKMGLLHLET